MAVFRIEKNRNYTVMSNYHLRDTSLSCKACGLLSKMLSLPENWDYTTRGLSMICKDGVDSIGSALKELERAGYLVRRQTRDARGRIRDIEYVIYEQPHPPEPDPPSPDTPPPDPENPDTVNPTQEEPCTEKPIQLNNNKFITEKQKTNQRITDPFLPPSPPPRPPKASEPRDGMKELERIKEQIEYDYLVTPANRVQLDELVQIMVEVEMNRMPEIQIGRSARYPTDYVRQRMRAITTEHMQRVLDAISENTKEVHHTKAYMLATLFNITATMDNYYTMRVNHDQYGSP